MLPTTPSVPHPQNVAPLDDGLPSPVPFQPETANAVAELVDAAEAMALLQLRVVPVTRAGASGPVEFDSEICSECKRQRVLSGMAHAASCGVGRVLAACAVLRSSGALKVYAEAYQRGWGDGQQRALDAIYSGRLTAAELETAAQRLEQVCSRSEAGR